MYKSKKSNKERIEETEKAMWEDVKNYMDDPQKLLEYLTFLKRFPQYSVRNRMMVRHQYPGAVALGSFKFFKDHDIHVKKGSKGLKIMVPTSTKYYYHEGAEGTKKFTYRQATKEEKALIKAGKLRSTEYEYFILGTVFDVTQTDLPRDEYPELFPNLHNDYETTESYNHEALLNGVSKILQKLGVSYGKAIPEVWNQGAAQGYYAPEQKMIVLNPDNTPTEDDTVLLHELGHAILHSTELNPIQDELHLTHHKKMSTPEMELEAEMTAYLISKEMGIDVSEKATRYIAAWTDNGNNIDPSRLLTFFDEVVKVADYVSNVIHQKVSENVA